MVYQFQGLRFRMQFIKRNMEGFCSRRSNERYRAIDATLGIWVVLQSQNVNGVSYIVQQEMFAIECENELKWELCD